jgi:pimeloyl-ACP methyl ester carboxylesterase
MANVEAKRAGTGPARARQHRGHGNRKSLVIDGPFTETKELLVGSQPQRGRSGFAAVNGLAMYYEEYGRGRPLVLMHGALTTIEGSFGKVRSALACTRRVIAVEQQAHGRTADIERPLTYAQMADDTAELLRQLDVEQADLFGFSMGAGAALQLAVRHPRLVRKLAVVAGAGNSDGYVYGAQDEIAKLDPTDDSWSFRLRRDFEQVGATRERWASAVVRAKDLLQGCPGLRPRDFRSIRAETLFVAGDAGIVRLDHVRDMADLVPRSHLKIFRGDDHCPQMVARAASMIPAFLDAPV